MPAKAKGRPVKVMVGCPTRGRVESAMNLARSVLRTGNIAEITFYVDDDQRSYYSDQFAHSGTDNYTRVHFVGGPRVGPVIAANRICEMYDADLFGMVPDDCEFTVNGWDEYALGLVDASRIAVLNPPHTFGTHIDIPFVTRGWLSVLTEFAPIPFAQWCWPTVIAILAEIGEVAVKCDPERFFIEHKMQMSEGASEKLPGDAVAFYQWCVHDLPPMLDKLRKRINEMRAATL